MTLLRESSTIAATAELTGWIKKPVIYEINTWVWLRELGQKYQRDITLAEIPPAEIEELASWGFDAIWLMGVWHRGHATRQSALNYLHEYRRTLPDVTEADVQGSAYAIRDYRVEEQFGGREGLAVFRKQIAAHGIKLVLDFVPNHVATDHGWIQSNPEYFIRGSLSEAEQLPSDYFVGGNHIGAPQVIARGRDPYFPAWVDTAQLNAFAPGLRHALTQTLIDIGSQCDGVRCDMAMLMMNDVFAMTWGERAGPPPKGDFWQEVLPAVREAHPQMMFMAEVYWDLEHELQLQGFDFTYDKRLYDRLIKQEIAAIRDHLSADPAYLRQNICFIENHDEDRALESFGVDRQWPAATLACTLPGAVLLHQGQLTGRCIKLPVQINRQPDEPRHPLLERFYRILLRELRHEVYRCGNWHLVDSFAAFHGDSSFQNLIAYTWDDGNAFRLIVVNLASEWSRAQLDLGHWTRFDGHCMRLYDVLHDTFRICDLDGRLETGLLLEAPPHGAQIFRVDRLECNIRPHG